MAFYNPVTVELFDENDEIITPVMVPLSITLNQQAFDFDYIAVQVETYDDVMREVLDRYTRKELIQYRISGRFGMSTGDLNSVYAYDEGGSGEFSFYGRSHKSIFNDVLGFIDPTLDAVQRTYTATHKRYTGSALKVVRDVLTDNVVKRLGLPMTFPTGDLGNEVTVDFRFDEIHKHLYKDGPDRGGAQLKEKGDIIFDVSRNFGAHRFELTARKPELHEQVIQTRSPILERWQITANRGEANRVVVGGPREGADRVFGSTEGVDDAPKTQEVAKSERALIESRIKALATTRDSSKAAVRKASDGRIRALQETLRKETDAANAAYAAAMQKAKTDYEAAIAKAKTDSERSSAKYTRESAERSAASTRDSAIDSAKRKYTDALKAENTTRSTDLRTADLKYTTDVATQKELLRTLLRQWPYPNRRFPAELYTEDTSPEGIDSAKLNPSDPQEKLNTVAEVSAALSKTAVTKREENGPFVTTSGELVESPTFYLGGTLRLGDYVMIGIDEDTLIGEQQIEKTIITWSKSDGYKVQLSKPDEAESTEAGTLKRVTSALADLSTKTGRR